MGRPFHLVAPEPSEHELQIACSEMLGIILLPDVQWTAIDHAHSTSDRVGRHGVPIGILEMRKRKRRGIRKGIWDYFFFHAARAYVVELKVGDNDLDEDQKEFGRGLLRAQIPIKVCWNADQVFATVSGWGLVRPGVALAAA